jgi:hypothetical protein
MYMEDTKLRVPLLVGTAVPTFLAIVAVMLLAVATVLLIAPSPGGVGVYLLTNWGIQVDMLLEMQGGEYAKLVEEGMTPEAVLVGGLGAGPAGGGGGAAATATATTTATAASLTAVAPAPVVLGGGGGGGTGRLDGGYL